MCTKTFSSQLKCKKINVFDKFDDPTKHGTKQFAFINYYNPPTPPHTHIIPHMQVESKANDANTILHWSLIVVPPCENPHVRDKGKIRLMTNSLACATIPLQGHFS